MEDKKRVKLEALRAMVNEPKLEIKTAVIITDDYGSQFTTYKKEFKAPSQIIREIAKIEVQIAQLVAKRQQLTDILNGEENGTENTRVEK